MWSVVIVKREELFEEEDEELFVFFREVDSLTRLSLREKAPSSSRRRSSTRRSPLKMELVESRAPARLVVLEVPRRAGTLRSSDSPLRCCCRARIVELSAIRMLWPKANPGF